MAKVSGAVAMADHVEAFGPPIPCNHTSNFPDEWWNDRRKSDYYVGEDQCVRLRPDSPTGQKLAASLMRTACGYGASIKFDADPFTPSEAKAGWQPTATAPKDKWLLVWDASGVNTNFSAAEVSRCRRDHWETSTLDIIHPTHWMPLPDAP